MDRHLKERLVGAAVLVAAAIVLIPEMLSGPTKETAAGRAAGQNPQLSLPAETQNDPTGDAGATKTYTIDLAAPKPAAAEVPADTKPEPIKLDNKAQSNQSQSNQPQSNRPLIETGPAPTAELPHDTKLAKSASASPPTKSEPVKSEPAKISPVVATPSTEIKGAETKSAELKGKWSVQVASFGVRATSDRIASELKARGFQAFVATSEIKGQTMYRVRVGAVNDRADAEALLKKVKPLHPNAAVVAQ